MRLNDNVLVLSLGVNACGFLSLALETAGDLRMEFHVVLSKSQGENCQTSEHEFS